MKIFLLLVMSLYCMAFSSTQTATVLQGTVTVASTGETLLGASIKILKGSDFVKGTVSDIDGRYRMQLDPGTYDIEITYTGYQTKKTIGVKVLEGQINTFDCAMEDGPVLTPVAYKVPLIEQDKSSSGGLTEEQIRSLPVRNVNSEIARLGTRETGTNYSLDGIRTEMYYSVDGIHVSRRPPPPHDYSIAGTTAALYSDKRPQQYGQIVESQFIRPKEKSASTFSVDVDGAAYVDARRFLSRGLLPPRDVVRVEEFVNYFDYQYKQPTDGKPIAVHTELVKCPWNPGHHLLSVALQGRDIEIGRLPPSNLVFMVDVSGSMNGDNKLLLVQSALIMLTEHLRPQDRVALVVFGGAAGLVLPSTPGTETVKIRAAIQNLGAGGSTADAEGIQLAYLTARENFAEGGNNRVIVCTDGDFSVSDIPSLLQRIEKERKKGIYLSMLGFGMGSLQDGTMQQLADKGNGNLSYVEQPAEAEKALMNELSGTSSAIARDIKIQIEFNSDKVAAYRLIGYENSVLNKVDLAEDTNDADEMKAGQRVTALYEIVPAGQDIPLTNKNGELEYQKIKGNSVSPGGDLLTLKLRYKQPKVKSSSELIQTVVVNTPSESMSKNLTLAAAAASFAMVLRNSPHKGNATLQSTLSLAQLTTQNDPSGYRLELCWLIELAQGMK